MSIKGSHHVRLGVLGLALAGVLALTLCASAGNTIVTDQQVRQHNWGIAIHGGAGTIDRGSLTPEMEAEYRDALTAALRAGHAVLERGGTSIDAVQAAIAFMEDSPLFNAGRGAVFTADGKNELDASIMDGRTLRAGAVAGLRHIANPIALARLVMDSSAHVMIIGEGAEAFAREKGVELVPESYFHTERRWQQLLRIQEQDRRSAPGGLDSSDEAATRMGTVGAVALDRAGNLAAGTSTGGTANKRWGRVGDSPIIGAGTYADNRCGAVSSTGTGEFFIRAVVAYDICAIALYQRVPLRDAADGVIMNKLVEMGGDGGVVVMDPQGIPSFSFNTAGMYRGFLSGTGEGGVWIYRE